MALDNVTCVLCDLFPERIADHDAMHHKFDLVEDDQGNEVLVELPIEPAPITCDRCGAKVDGFRGQYATAGFYDTAGQSWWARYARPGERIVCDACMWADPGYRADYGIHEPAPIVAEMLEVDAISRESYGSEG